MLWFGKFQKDRKLQFIIVVIGSTGYKFAQNNKLEEYEGVKSKVFETLRGKKIETSPRRRSSIIGTLCHEKKERKNR